MYKFVIGILSALILILPVTAQDRIIPILDTEIGGLLGGVAGERFVKADAAYKAVANSRETHFYSYSPVRDLETRRKVVSISPVGDECADYYPVLIDPPAKGILIGTNADWRPDVRKPQILWDRTDGGAWQNKTYQGIVAGFLRKQGLRNPNVRILEALKVDLEGDGTDEVILSAAYYKSRRDPFQVSIGDYHLVLLRKIVDGKVRDLMIRGDFKVIRESDGSVVDNRIYAVLDLNGDGRLEVIVHSFYPEARYSEVYEIEGADIRTVMWTGCGA